MWVFFDLADPKKAVLARTAHSNYLPLVFDAILILSSVVSLVKR